MSGTRADPSTLHERFLALCELEPAARAVELTALRRAQPETAGELAELLRAHETNAGFLETPALGIELAWGEFEPEAAQPPPARIGRYTLQVELGRGGMGVVYRATQESPQRTVALKVVDGARATPERLRRFEHEAELLARLSHPGIAQVFEAGTVQENGRTRAFMAMELVAGEDLRRHARTLDPRARLVLLVRIAEAVAHAHQKGIVHRDLKPENILVDAHGAPRIVDFGVARWIGAASELASLHTAAGHIIGTPWYMSPEQLAGEADAADTRSDVYALGVIGHELFSGALPYALAAKPLAEVARIIRDVAPARLAGDTLPFPDLATVLAKCLAKEPERRYGSASELAADLARVLAHEPVSARPPSGLYLLSKFVRRNRALALTSGLALLALVLGLAGFALQAQRVAGQRDRARAAEALAEQRLLAMQRERDKFEHGFAFLNEMLRSVDPNRDGQDVRVADLLQRAGQTLADAFPSEPRLEADLRRALGGSWRALGGREEALHELGLALELLEKSGDAGELDLARNDVALLLTELGRYDEALPLYRSALARQQALLGTGARETLVTTNNLAALQQRRGELAGAESLFRAVLAGESAVSADAEAARLFGSARRGLADLLEDRGELAEACTLLAQGLERLRTHFGERDTDVLATLANLAALEASSGALELAIGHLRSCLAGYAELLPAGHPSVLTLQNNLGTLLVRARRFDEGEALLAQALEGRRKTLGPEHASTLTTASNLGGAWLDLGRLAEAETLLADTRAALLRTLPPGHWMPHATGVRLAECWSRMGRKGEARELAEESLSALRAALGAQSEKTRSAATLAARLAGELGDPGRAQALRQEFALDEP